MPYLTQEALRLAAFDRLDRMRGFYELSGWGKECHEETNYDLFA